MLNLQNPALNEMMAETGAKKIGFLKTVETNYLDQRKLDAIEMLKVKTNEFDERLLQKQTFMQDGKMHTDVIPTVYNHQAKMNLARKELRNMQSTFNSVLANPSYDNQIQQIDEVEKLKIELARKGIQAPIETLKRGMVLAEREQPANEGPKKYLRGDEYLMVNPNKKSKKNKAKGLKRAGSIKKTKKLGSPKSPKRGRRGTSVGSGDEFGL